MKKIGLSIALIMLVSCVKTILPEADYSIEGRWAQINESNYTARMLEFEMGKCYTYQSPVMYFFDEGTIWGCPVNVFWQVSCEYYAIKDSCLVLSSASGRDSVNVGRIFVEGDYLSIGEGNFSRVRKITDSESGLVSVKSVALNKREMTLFPDEISPLSVTIIPMIVRDSSILWKSDNPDVADVSDAGLVRAVSPGVANVCASAIGGAYDVCRVTVKEK